MKKISGISHWIFFSPGLCPGIQDIALNPDIEYDSRSLIAVMVAS